MKRTSKRVIAFFLILVLVLSLCACAQKQQAGTDEPNRSADGETLSGMPVCSRHRPDSPRKRNNLLFGCGREWLFRRPCSARPSWAIPEKRLMEIGCQKQTKRRCRNTLLFPKSIRGIPSGTMIICIVSCRLMKMPRFPSISCGGIRNQILKRSSRFSIGLKLEIRC